MRRLFLLPLHSRMQHVLHWHGCISDGKLKRIGPWISYNPVLSRIGLPDRACRTDNSRSDFHFHKMPRDGTCNTPLAAILQALPQEATTHHWTIPHPVSQQWGGEEERQWIQWQWHIPDPILSIEKFSVPFLSMDTHHQKWQSQCIQGDKCFILMSQLPLVLSFLLNVVHTFFVWLHCQWWWGGLDKDLGVWTVFPALFLYFL